MATSEPDTNVPTTSAYAPEVTSDALSAIVEEEFNDPRHPQLLNHLVQLGSKLKRKLEEIEVSSESQERSGKSVTACSERDGNECILSKDGTYDVVHLYPFSLRNNRTTFWELLDVFWSESRVQSWKQAVFPNGAYEEDICYNMISLSPTAHRYYDKAYFALKPISLSDDQKRFIVQFFWLSQGDFKGNPRVLVNLDSKPSLVVDCVGPARVAFDTYADRNLQFHGEAGRFDSGDLQGRNEDLEEPKQSMPDYISKSQVDTTSKWKRSRLWNHKTGDPIRSGDMITLETHDPISHPLPKWEIVEMQWFLQRAAAISGAAEVPDDYDYDDYDPFGVRTRDGVEMEDDDDYMTEF